MIRTASLGSDTAADPIAAPIGGTARVTLAEGDYVA
jgi:hypothetical protein